MSTLIEHRFEHELSVRLDRKICARVPLPSIETLSALLRFRSMSGCDQCHCLARHCLMPALLVVIRDMINTLKFVLVVAAV